MSSRPKSFSLRTSSGPAASAGNKLIQTPTNLPCGDRKKFISAQRRHKTVTAGPLYSPQIPINITDLLGRRKHSPIASHQVDLALPVEISQFGCAPPESLLSARVSAPAHPNSSGSRLPPCPDR